MPKKEKMKKASLYEEFREKRTKLDKATQKYMETKYFYKLPEKILPKKILSEKILSKKIFSNYQKLSELYHSKARYQKRVDALNDVYQEHVKALYEAFEKHQKNGQVSKENKQLIQEFEKAYCNSIQSAGIFSPFELLKYSSKAIAIFKEKPKEGIEILKLCTEFLKVHNEWEITYLKREQAQQQASQSNNTTLSGSHVAKLAQNRANSNSNSNENSR